MPADPSHQTTASGRRNAECCQCLRVRPLVLPVRQECMGVRFTDWLCAPCRMDYNRAAAARGYGSRIEGRHQRGGAMPLPCSLAHLEWRAAHVR